MTKSSNVLKRLAALDLPVFQKMLGASTLPLRVGIDVDVKARLAPQDHRVAQRLLGNFVNTVGYLKAVTEPASRRHDIEGQPVAEITDHERERARQRLRQVMMARRAKNKAREKRATTVAKPAARKTLTLKPKR